MQTSFSQQTLVCSLFPVLVLNKFIKGDRRKFGRTEGNFLKETIRYRMLLKHTYDTILRILCKINLVVGIQISKYSRNMSNILKYAIYYFFNSSLNS